MTKEILNRLLNRAIIIAHDLFMVPLAWFGAYWLRFNMDTIPQPFLHQAVNLLPVLLIAQGAAFWFFGLYRGIWSFASLPDLVRIGKAILIGTILAAVFMFLVTRLQGVPRSIIPLYAIFLALLIGGPRLLYRWYKDRRLGITAAHRVLVVGAGRGGEMLVRDLLRPHGDYLPIGFVDDDRTKIGNDIHGLRVFGDIASIPEVVHKYDIELIVVAIPSATSRAMRRIVELCESTKLPFRTLPGSQDIAGGRAVMNTLREVSIDDLLGREPVRLDWQAIKTGIHGRRVLITGGGGSIGSELCRQIARLEPAHLMVLDNCEFNLYRIEQELRRTFPALTLVCRLGDVTNAAAMQRLLAEFPPHVLFHAAAYKHVPMLEDMPLAAMHNNAIGTRTIADVAVRSGVESFILISTDKAVHPSNVMGASKRLAELYCQNLGASVKTRFVTVRFGNVLDSAGSVVPLFRDQIARGGPVTVTHAEATRYFMTIPEACQLITQAAAMGQGGEIFVLDMGEPMNITYLAEQMIRLAGKTPGTDVEIVFTGLRPGEKLHEELFYEQEQLVKTDCEKILQARRRETDGNLLRAAFTRIQRACGDYDAPSLEQVVNELFPEYRHSRSGGGESVDNVISFSLDHREGRAPEIT